MPALPAFLRSLRIDQRGAVSTEYLVLTAMGLAVVVGLGVLGASMVDGYGTSLQFLYSDVP